MTIYDMENLLTIRNSEQASWGECRQQWYWGYVERIKPIAPSKPLTIGDMFHQALEVWYPPGIKRGKDPVKHAQKLYRAFVRETGNEMLVKGDPDDPDSSRVTAGELLTEMLTNYLNLYGDDEWMEILAPEMAFQVVFYDSVGRPFLFVGQIDGVFRNLITGRVGFLENKTGAGLRPFGAPLSLDEQSGSYWAFAPAYLLKHGYIEDIDEVDFVMFNRARKAFADRRPVNADGHALNLPKVDALKARLDELGLSYGRGLKREDFMEILREHGEEPELLGEVSTRQPDPLFKREYVYRSEHDRWILMERVKHRVTEQRLAKKGKLAIIKTPGRHCGWCAYVDMCEVHESGSDWEALRDATMTKWEPYAAHEVAAERRH